MDFEKIKERYTEFIKWDENTLDNRLQNITAEYAMFQHLYFETSKKITTTEKELDELWIGKFKWYKHNFEETLTNTEIKAFIEKDNEIIGFKHKIGTYSNYLNFFTEAMKNLSSMRWDMKSYIDFIKFKSGLN